MGFYIVFVAILLFFSLASPFFLTTTNLFDVLRQSTFVLVVALGMTFVIMTAGIDLSVGAILGLSAGITSWLLLRGVPTARCSRRSSDWHCLWVGERPDHNPPGGD